MILLLKFILALCSMAWELVLAQALSAFLENTVLRYSTTIGLYLLAMGAGAFVVERWLARPWQTLWRTELALTLAGALSVPALFFVDHMFPASGVFATAAYGLIALIGFLTGFELPLLLKASRDSGRPARRQVIAMDYAGAFAGSLIFVFVLYPRAGLVASVLWIALLNAAAGGIILRRMRQEGAVARAVGWVQAALMAGAALAALFAPSIERFLFHVYTG